jgi:hypothetical protein
VHEAAKQGIAGERGKLPYLDTIQKAFGRHDVTGVVAHTGAQATAGAQAMGAAAFTMGNHVAFAGTADLRTAAHEAAHVVQQRAGVQLMSGVGEVGDPYERHADRVADAVVQGRSAQPLLARGPHAQERAPGASSMEGGDAPVQRKVGFEFELAIPISPKGPGDDKAYPDRDPTQDALNASKKITPSGIEIAFTKEAPFHVQNDLGYSRIGKAKKKPKTPEIGESIMEIVTAPVDEYAPDAEDRLQDTVGGAMKYVEGVMSLEPATRRSPLPGNEVSYMVGYPLAAGEGEDRFARGKLSPDAFVQINIGIVPRALTEFHEFVSASHTGSPSKKRQLASATQSARGATQAADPGGKLDASVREEVTGFLVLLIDLLIGGKTTSLSHDKNIVPVLSKTDLYKLRTQALSPEAQAALTAPEIFKYLIDEGLLPKSTPKKRARRNEHYLFHDFGKYEGKVGPHDEERLAGLGNPLRETFAVTALQAPASSGLDEIGEGFTLPTLEKGAIDPDELGPLEGRASSQKPTEKSEAAEPGTLGAVLEVRNNPGYHAPDQWFEIGKYWLDVARKMNAKRG